MDIETMPHTMYFTGSSNTVTKINQVPYKTIEYNDNGMFTAKLMTDTPIEIFIDNGATLQTAFYWFLPCRDLLPVSLFCIRFPGFLVPRCALLFGEYL